MDSLVLVEKIVDIVCPLAPSRDGLAQTTSQERIADAKYLFLGEESRN
jgi:hypothetical protein